MSPNADMRFDHGLDMAVQVVKAATGRVTSYVNESALIPLGFLSNEEEAVRLYCEQMETERLASGDDTPSWFDTEIVVYRDEVKEMN